MTPGHDPIPGQNTHRYLIEDGAQCLKSTEKVAFNIASEVSYIYIFKLTKIGWKWQNWKTKMRHFGWFSYTVKTKLPREARHTKKQRWEKPIQKPEFQGSQLLQVAQKKRDAGQEGWKIADLRVSIIWRNRKCWKAIIRRTKSVSHAKSDRGQVKVILIHLLLILGHFLHWFWWQGNDSTTIIDHHIGGWVHY